MIDNSSRYGLHNPAFTDDIGRSMLEKQYGRKIEDYDDYAISGTSNSFNNINFANRLPSDKVDLSTKKEKMIKNTAIGIGTIIAALAAWKFGAFTKLGRLISKIPGGDKLTNFVKSLSPQKLIPNSIKNKFKNISLKNITQHLKGFSFKSIGQRIKGIFKK